MHLYAWKEYHKTFQNFIIIIFMYSLTKHFLSSYYYYVSSLVFLLIWSRSKIFGWNLILDLKISSDQGERILIRIESIILLLMKYRFFFFFFTLSSFNFIYLNHSNINELVKSSIFFMHL